MSDLQLGRLEIAGMTASQKELRLAWEYCERPRLASDPDRDLKSFFEDHAAIFYIAE